jgi:hypothetical protein
MTETRQELQPSVAHEPTGAFFIGRAFVRLKA